jgi:parvulin-like peptidyl-prolyl isomerase
LHQQAYILFYGKAKSALTGPSHSITEKTAVVTVTKATEKVVPVKEEKKNTIAKTDTNGDSDSETPAETESEDDSEEGSSDDDGSGIDEDDIGEEIADLKEIKLQAALQSKIATAKSATVNSKAEDSVDDPSDSVLGTKRKYGSECTYTHDIY